MIVYSRIGIRLKEEASEKSKQQYNELYKEFKTNCAKYCIDEGMQLYRIPINTDAYKYAQKLIALGKKEVGILELFEKVYDKKDYKMGVAFKVSFRSIVYGYDDEAFFDYYSHCCEEGSIVRQIKDYRVPKKEFTKKQYGQLDIGEYVVSEKIRDELIQIGALQEDFKPIKTKKDELVCYQIAPVNEISGFSELNNMKIYEKCEKCKIESYDYDDKKPFFINQAILNSMMTLNKTSEKVGDNGIPFYLINKEAYEYLNKQYPRMQFEPVFLDKE